MVKVLIWVLRLEAVAQAACLAPVAVPTFCPAPQQFWQLCFLLQLFRLPTLEIFGLQHRPACLRGPPRRCLGARPRLLQRLQACPPHPPRFQCLPHQVLDKSHRSRLRGVDIRTLGVNIALKWHGPIAHSRREGAVIQGKLRGVETAKMLWGISCFSLINSSRRGEIGRHAILRW